MEKVKITFADKSEIEAEKNGDSFITDEKPSFPEDLSTVTITGEDSTQTVTNASVIECASVDGRYWFGFRQATEAEKLRADVDYLLCMEN